MSWLTKAVAGLESRLDNILADDPDVVAKQRPLDEAQGDLKTRPRAGSGNLSAPNGAAGTSRSVSRDASGTRGGNERLAERLARATAQKRAEGGALGSGVPSRTGTPVAGLESASPRASMENSQEGEAPRPIPHETLDDTHENGSVTSERVSTDGLAKSNYGTTLPSTLLTSSLPMNPARHSTDSSARPSVDAPRLSNIASSRQSSELANGSRTSKSTSELESDMMRMRIAHEQAEKQRQEEMHAYLERIDALQAKLQYLAKETVAAAKEANASTSTGSPEAKLAEKDERIALLMEEGEKLSKTELWHLQTIKKLRVKITDNERAETEQRRKLERSERAESDLKQKLRRAEAAERQAAEKSRQLPTLEKQVKELQVDRDRGLEQIRKLNAAVKTATKNAEQAQKDAAAKAAESDKGRIAELENELEDAQIEKKLASDRATSEIRKVREEAKRQRERAGVRELDLKNEIAGLDSRLEGMRAHVEEASSDGGVAGEGSIKLMRQVETLQSQYSAAKSNWETIESSLTARLSALERERDEASKREADVRKKARDTATRTRKAEEAAESASDTIASLKAELQAQGQSGKDLQKSFEQAEAALADAKADTACQRRVWESELTNRLEEEKARWQRQSASPALRTGSPSLGNNRKFSSQTDARRPTSSNHRLVSNDLSSLYLYNSTSSRHNPNFPLSSPNYPPAMSRQDSTLSFSPSTSTANPNTMPPTPSIEVDGADFTLPPETNPHSSPQQTLADIMSTSTAAAGPSVQLVERMSAAVRRLESEKATQKDEMARVVSQRDEARDEIVRVMREQGEAPSQAREEELRKRYESVLELLGEREEELEGLREDVGELKGIYKELVERKVGR